MVVAVAVVVALAVGVAVAVMVAMAVAVMVAVELLVVRAVVRAVAMAVAVVVVVARVVARVLAMHRGYGASQCRPLNNALNPTLGLKTSFIALIFRYIPLHTFGANHFYNGGNQKRVPF